ncbi:MAG: hypothetical protein JNK53_01260 [Phycisphaerae bacterium]|nr:hypothetical protein [Phycisphaerae bacterium]
MSAARSGRRVLLLACVVLGAAAGALHSHIRPACIARWTQCLLDGGSFADAQAAYEALAMQQDADRLLEMPQNEPLARFLQEHLSLVQPAPRVESFRLRWEDPRGQVLHEGCRETKTYDPRLPKVEADVVVPFDLAAAEAMESRFGCPDPFPTIWGRSDVAWAMPALEQRVREVLRVRGLVYDGESVRIDYAGLVEQSLPGLVAVVPEVLRVFPRIANQAGRPPEVVALVSLVQRGVRYVAIPRQPGWENGGMRSPLMTLRYGGDCDSKSVLLAALLRVVNARLPIVLITTKGGAPIPGDSENHMLLGVAIPATECDATIRHQGVDYVLIETTDGWGIGVAPDGFDAATIEHIIDVPVRP